MKVSRQTIGLAVMCCSLIIASCANKLDRNAPIGAETTQCAEDCVMVSKAFVKEHAVLFDENIRFRAALKFCQEKR